MAPNPDETADTSAKRRTVVGALAELAASADYRDRADAGRALASFAETAEAQSTLRRLILDAHDTFVTRVTAEALLRRHDAAGLAVVADAWTSVDFIRRTHIHDALRATFGMFAAERDSAVEACDTMARRANTRVRRGAAELRDLLTGIQPVLYPERQPGAADAGLGEVSGETAM